MKAPDKVHIYISKMSISQLNLISDYILESNEWSNIGFGEEITQAESIEVILTLRPPSLTIVPYANCLDPDETPSDSASHPDPSCLKLRQHFHQL